MNIRKIMASLLSVALFSTFCVNAEDLSQVSNEEEVVVAQAAEILGVSTEEFANVVENAIEVIANDETLVEEIAALEGSTRARKKGGVVNAVKNNKIVTAVAAAVTVVGGYFLYAALSGKCPFKKGEAPVVLTEQPVTSSTENEDNSETEATDTEVEENPIS